MYGRQINGQGGPMGHTVVDARSILQARLTHRHRSHAFVVEVRPGNVHFAEEHTRVEVKMWKSLPGDGKFDSFGLLESEFAIDPRIVQVKIRLFEFKHA